MVKHSGPLWECNGRAPAGLSDARGWAFFLDVDGTLVELADTPSAIRPVPGLADRLARLGSLVEGAVALVSGRPLSELDQLFAPHRFPAAGIHGAELRLGPEVERRVEVDPSSLDVVRRAFRRFVIDHPGTLVEDKALAITLHYRLNPGAAEDAHALADRLSDELGPDFHVLEGKMVVEIRSRSATKGSAVEAFMQIRPFAGRRPVYVGDDITDEDAFRTVNEAGGRSIVVGSRAPTAAAQRLADVDAVHRWLCEAVTYLEGVASSERGSP